MATASSSDGLNFRKIQNHTGTTYTKEKYVYYYVHRVLPPLSSSTAAAALSVVGTLLLWPADGRHRIVHRPPEVFLHTNSTVNLLVTTNEKAVDHIVYVIPGSH